MQGDGSAKQTCDDAKRKAEVQTTPTMNHRHHGEHHDSIHAEPVECIRKAGPHIHSHKRSKNEKNQQEQRNDDSWKAKRRHHAFD
ncbi:hypothetical protein SDC9_114630 [bioreactor metagenome]|uniref:Uncharacterized protein n=1 Tax=bioreactor metagenome TaxID=1076179 RepID=A0A645BQR6_9ZZZZ